MDEELKDLHCIGCGALLQTTNPDLPGYTPASVLKRALTTGDDLYCQRCFRLRHYNEIADVNATADDFLKLLNEIGKADALIVNVVDIFDFNGSIIPGLHHFVGNNPVILVGNKVDILPRDINLNKVTRWLNSQAKLNGLNPIATQLISAKNGQHVDQLLQLINQYRHHRDVYLVGVTNVGKSTLINQIIQQLTGQKNVITTSRFPGTTLDKIEIPLDDGHYLIDTPGIVHEHQMAHFLGAKDLKLIAPQKPIKPKVYQLLPQQTLFLGGLARFDYIKGAKKQGFVAYLDNQLMIHRTKLANADNFYQKHVGELLQPPRPQEVTAFPPLQRFEFAPKEKSDIVFAGLGWIKVPADTLVAGYAPQGVDVMIRKSLI
ncbi:MAG: ribosome biogenesis GTPase YqeH [Candidatus Paralactobacillus gallistercoris]|uniref:Ribosome biogenesis GTPase YqeH n=1 Tax=Candidatus Paralactobacillus gallistercoris TaxID=2838724 RepID=A0A948TJS8_9LACO|nr:ribosome biogenesis GTPase YqeH [Candidatus Paralactobacillus gallistercoris]